LEDSSAGCQPFQLEANGENGFMGFWSAKIPRTSETSTVSQVATTGFWSECRLTSFCCFENPGYGHLENFNWPWKTMENPAFMDCPLNPLKIGISH
jgi:hypothetical protein